MQSQQNEWPIKSDVLVAESLQQDPIEVPATRQPQSQPPTRRKRKAKTGLPTEALLDALADGFIVVDGEGFVRYVNAAVTRALDRRRDQLLNCSVWDAFPEAVGLPFFLHYHWVLSTGEAAQFEAYYPPLDRWLEVRLSPLPDGGVAASIWEVSGRKQLEAKLRESEARFRATFEQAAIGIAHVAMDGRLLRVNDRLCALLGRSRDEVLASTMQDLTHPDDVGANVSYMRQVLAGERETYCMEKRYLRPDGSVVWGELTGSLVRDDCKVPLYFIGAVEDITERKRLEAEVATRASQLQAVFDAITDGVLVLDMDGAIADANAAARRQLPNEFEEFNALSRGQRAELFQMRLAGNGQTTLEDWPFTRLLRGESLTGDMTVDMIMRLRDGRECEVSVGGAPIRDAQGNVTGVVSVIRDVTERRRLERQRVHILRMVAHELGNPLSVAKLTLTGYRRRQGARSAADPAPQTTTAASDSAQLPDYLDDALARMQRLVGDLNTAVRLDGAGDLSLQRRRFDLAALCRHEAQLLQSVTGRVLRLRIPRRRVEVEADSDAVGRVITNLLSNADKYSPSDRPIALSLTSGARGQARVAVRDRGPGIPKAERQRIWEQFHRVPGVEAREMAGGLGLGLAICRGIIEQLGGQIGVKSQVGVGSTFWFTLSPVPGACGTPAH